MKCPGCNNLLGDDAVFCDKCGALVKNEVPAANNQQARGQYQKAEETAFSAPVYRDEYAPPKEEVYYREKPKTEKKSSTGIIIGVMIGVIVTLIIAIVAILLISSGFGESSVQPVPTATVMPTESPEPVKKISSYEVVKSNMTWSEAESAAEGADSHLVYINDREEFEKVCQKAEGAGINVFWVGARRYRNDSWYDATWLDGSEITYEKWFDGEPSYTSEDNMDEMYLMVFKVDGEWYFNDAENDVERFYKGKMGYIVETEE